jgi:2-polyprenyl-3-methyl-5-hydroxy-6-metoxy-1,4-benzoquinol methylase
MRERLIYRNDGNRALLAMLPRPPGHILDCGCGAGDNARLAAALGWHVTGITIDAREREAALPYCDDVVIADLELGLPSELPERFDVVLMSHILEHLAHPGHLLADVRGRLGAAGVAAVALPNVLHYQQRLRFLRGNFAYHDDGIMDRTHLHFYTYTTAKELLEEHGFAIIAAVPDGGLPWWKLRRLVPEGSRLPIDRWASLRMPNLLAHQCLFLARAA